MTTRLKKFIPLFSTRFRRIGRSEVEADEGALEIQRYKPESLGALLSLTRFSRAELKSIYCGFKQECPTGIVSNEKFRDIFSQFFPQGEAAHYANHVFRTFDKEQAGVLTFEQFATGLSRLARGSREEKLSWAFELYDVDGDGHITRDEMLSVLRAIYELMGAVTAPSATHPHSHSHHRTPDEVHSDPFDTRVALIFEKFDLNKDGIIDFEEFIEACLKDETLCSSLTLFDTIL